MKRKGTVIARDTLPVLASCRTNADEEGQYEKAER